MKPDIALIGCGAIAQIFYLPALYKKRQEFGNVWLVDPNDRVLAAAAKMIDCRACRFLKDVPSNIEMAIISAPNSLHFLLAQQAIDHGAHLLIEKPMVIWPEEGRTLLALAAARQRIVAVNQTRRFMPYARDLRRQIQFNAFGRLKSITHFEGQKLSWPFESGAAFHRSAERTGVIMDLGVHVIDLYQYLFNPIWRLVKATHDGFRGPEGLAEIELEADGCPVFIRLSRYQKQSNIARLVFDQAEIAIDLEALNQYTIRGLSGLTKHVSVTSSVLSYDALADDVLSDFIAACLRRVTPICSAASSLPVIAILDEIYCSATCYVAEIGTV